MLFVATTRGGESLAVSRSSHACSADRTQTPRAGVPTEQLSSSAHCSQLLLQLSTTVLAAAPAHGDVCKSCGRQISVFSGGQMDDCPAPPSFPPSVIIFLRDIHKLGNDWFHSELLIDPVENSASRCIPREVLT